MRIALDTNLIAYAEGVGDARRCRAARALVARLPGRLVVVPTQALGELYRVLIGKARRTPPEAKAAVLAWADAFEIADSTLPAMRSALDLAAGHGLAIWDSLILSVAAETQCRLLVSEDLQHGFMWRGVTVVDPFRSPRDALLAAALT